MKVLLVSFLLCALFGVYLALDLKVQPDYYTLSSSQVFLKCGDAKWNKNNTPVVFYYDSNKVIYNSSRPNDNYPFVKSLRDNTTVELNSKGVRGWYNLKCSVNKTVSDPMNVPFLEGPGFSYSPSKFEYNKKFTFGCKGFIAPKQALNVTFRLNNTRLAGFVNGQFNVYNDPGLTVNRAGSSNDSITVVPKNPSHRGQYSCSFTFYINKKPKEVQSGRWSTSGIDALTSKTILVIFTALFAAFANLF